MGVFMKKIVVFILCIVFLLACGDDAKKSSNNSDGDSWKNDSDIELLSDFDISDKEDKDSVEPDSSSDQDLLKSDETPDIDYSDTDLQISDKDIELPDSITDIDNTDSDVVDSDSVVDADKVENDIDEILSDENDSNEIDDEDTVYDAEPIAFTDYKSTFVEQYCNHLFKCPEKQDESRMAVLENKEKCISYFSKIMQFIGDAEIEAYNQGRIIYNEQKAGACMEVIKNLSCDYNTDLAPEECKNIITGTVEDGGVCNVSEECINGSCDTTKTCPSTCQPFVLEGESCLDNKNCEPGTECLSNGAICVTVKTNLAENEECRVGFDRCAENLYCNFNSGVCEPVRKLNESCDWSDACAFGLKCNESEGICLKPENIQVFAENAVECNKFDKLCDYTKEFFCLDNKCQFFDVFKEKENGESCETAFDCVNGTCVAGLCTDQCN